MNYHSFHIKVKPQNLTWHYNEVQCKIWYLFWGFIGIVCKYKTNCFNPYFVFILLFRFTMFINS